MSDIVERLRSQSILDVWHPMMLEAAAEILRLRAENEKLRAALNSIEEYIAGRVHMHNQIAGFAGSSLSGKKQRVRASEAADILGKIRATAAAYKETDDGLLSERKD